MVWKPNITVAAITERNGKFLLVEELTEFGARFNQPAGHLEPNETITEGVIRETLEETAYAFKPEAVVGIYYWRYPNKNLTYLRFAFSGAITNHDTQRKLDKGIIRADWYSVETIRGMINRHRSPLVMQCIDDYLLGKRFPIELITHYD